MNHQLVFDDLSSATIRIVLFVLRTVFDEGGFRSGGYAQARTDDEIRNPTGASQASVPGLLALWPCSRRMLIDDWTGR